MTDPVVAPKTALKPVTTKHLAYELADQHQLSKKQSLEMMEALVGMITKHLKKGERVKIVGLGILQVRNRAARMGRNPATGEPIQIKASKKVAFRASKDLKEAIRSPTRGPGRRIGLQRRPRLWQGRRALRMRDREVGPRRAPRLRTLRCGL